MRSSKAFDMRWCTLLLRVAAWIVMFMPCAVKAEMQIVVREMFEGVKTLNSESPGSLGTWTSGAWHCRPAGPRLEATAAPGWSGDAQTVHTKTCWDLTREPYDSARDGGMIGCWVRFEDLSAAGYFNSTGSANPAMVLQLSSGDNNAPFQMIGVTQSGLLLTRTIEGWAVGGTVQEKTWYWMQVEWIATETSFSGKASYQPLGGELKELTTQTVAVQSYQATTAYVMNAPYEAMPGQQYTWQGRLGGAVLASIDAMGEGSQMSDVLPPVEERHTWYLDPVAGDDQNDGLSPDRAWKTVTKFNQESFHSGLLSPLGGGYPLGDTLIINTAQAELDLGREQFLVNTPGLTIKPAPGQEKIRMLACKNISGSKTTWVPAGLQTYSNVWMTNDNEATDLTDVVIWENDRWLNHPVGGSAADVLASLNSVPGSFYSDGTTLYLHPFGSSNPNTDGKSYTRSRFRVLGESAVKLLAPDLFIQGIDVRKTALAQAATNDPYTSYGIQGELGFGGVTVLKNCFVSYAGKHCIGFTDSNSNRDVTVDACQVEQGTPYASQSPWVDYNGIVSATGNRTTYLHCINYKPAGRIGSIAGNTQECLSYYAHNNGEGLQFESIHFVGGVYGGQVSTGGGIKEITLEGVVFGGGTAAADIVNVTRCVISQLPMSNVLPHGILTARHNN